MKMLAKKQCPALSLLYAYHGRFVSVGALPHAATHPERGLRSFMRANNKDTKDLFAAQLLSGQQCPCL
jgi:hypothetical protein